jgi:membrane fusion protein
MPDVPVAIVMPEGGRLEAHLFVPTRAIGFVSTGQNVGIKYEAFPYQEFGIQSGRVLRVETTVLSPSELHVPVALSEPVYRLVAELEAQSVVTAGRRYPLQAGMLLDANLVLENRSVLAWLLKPFYGLLGAS